MVEMVNCARDSETEEKLAFNFCLLFFSFTSFGAGNLSQGFEVSSMEYVQWLCMYYGVQNPVSKDRLVTHVLYKSYHNTHSNPPS